MWSFLFAWAARMYKLNLYPHPNIVLNDTEQHENLPTYLNNEPWNKRRRVAGAILDKFLYIWSIMLLYLLRAYYLFFLYPYYFKVLPWWTSGFQPPRIKISQFFNKYFFMKPLLICFILSCWKKTKIYLRIALDYSRSSELKFPTWW